MGVSVKWENGKTKVNLVNIYFIHKQRERERRRAGGVGEGHTYGQKLKISESEKTQESSVLLLQLFSRF